MINAWWIVFASSLTGLIGFLLGAMCAVARDEDTSEDHARVRYKGR